MLAHTQSGTLEGVERGGVSAFRGVPYAASPTGALRWRPPQAAMAWAGVRPAGTFGNAAAQSPLLGVAEPLDEDCLYLNVWTPGTDDAAPPVMVWIHGGAFEFGAGSQAIYDGARLALRGDVVVVTINYRMGPFGFLRLVDATGGRPATGSEGMLDRRWSGWPETSRASARPRQRHGVWRVRRRHRDRGCWPCPAGAACSSGWPETSRASAATTGNVTPCSQPAARGDVVRPGRRRFRDPCWPERRATRCARCRRMRPTRACTAFSRDLPTRRMFMDRYRKARSVRPS